MTADEILTPTLIFPDSLACASLAGRGPNRHRFGGPLELDIKGWPKRHPQPHRLATLFLSDPACGLNTSHYAHIPLIYGFELDGCRLKYRVSVSRRLEVTECQGQREKDWPYAGYPIMFPTLPLYFQAPKSIDWKELESNEDWSGLTRQDSRPGPNEVLVVVPSNDAYGVSLWGWSGDRNGTQVVFRVNLESLIVEAWNETS